MQVITLKDNLSEHFDLVTYPDGQHNVWLRLDKLSVKDIVKIRCRIKNFGELEVFLCLVAALRKNDFRIASIDFVYLYGMRSDRAFRVEECSYFRHILAPIFNSIPFRKNIFCPHSILVGADHPAMGCEYRDILNREICWNNYYCIGGDEGSTYNFGYILDNHFVKQRKMSGMTVSLHKAIEDDKPILVVDDLCDGGATFIAEAKFLQREYPGRSLNLFVAHGLFTKGFEELFGYFDKVITTNSYQDFTPNEKLQVIEVI